MSSKAVIKKTIRSTRPVRKPRTATAALKRRRPIHKRVLLHPITVFFLLCVGVFIVGSTIRALASDITVTAKVAAPALIDGAFIVAPTDGATYTQDIATITGTCPSNSYVKLTKNAVLAGVAVCDSNGAFELTISLFSGSNILRAQAYNFTDDPGPVTPEVTVVYNAPEVIPPGPISVPEIPSQGTDSDGVDVSHVDIPGDLPVVLTSFEYNIAEVTNVFSWDIYLAGGKAPYTLYLNWGDGTETTMKPTKAEKVTIKHTYKKQGYYTIKIKMVDAKNKVSMMQLVAVVKTPASSGAKDNVINGAGSRSFFGEGWALLVKNWLAVAWGSYITVTLMVVSFWLGERQELNELALRRRHRGHKA